jgi:uncharacterized protein YihD (DUF1040 family)
MRDFRRIPRIMEIVEKIWITNPDLRLTQLLGNCFEAGDLYYVDDDTLEKRLKEVYNVS